MANIVSFLQASAGSAGPPQRCSTNNLLHSRCEFAHVHGYPWLDALKGQMSDRIDVLTSTGGKTFTDRGRFNLRLRWKDLPADFMWPDNEQLFGHMFDLVLPQAVEARHVRVRINSSRMVGVTEVQALDSVKVEPFDLRIALPGDRAPAKPRRP